ncbi:GntR family transcriptional regulator [Amycolatopsis rubida]|uniref:GntR family transcriptional regulator / MocR family aminotransferase n=1 Tax=Amycolatopsis rubida TaxID=112413 RepID=A0A1I5YU30_9PSEU|nr:GntR family transcriptional regulator [Amycolatopsis rubida]SFQ47716.1 GntR family transcriptional regulator / MocR family aminotransferase [Amycolatopsis rubida]
MKRASAADGLDLYLPASTTRPAHALETALRAAVVDGRLPAGTRLPASRALATDLGIARSTVSEIYSRLAAEERTLALALAADALANGLSS